MRSATVFVVCVLALLGHASAAQQSGARKQPLLRRDSAAHRFANTPFNFLFGGNLKGENGGTTCAGCTILVALVEQYAQIQNTSIVNGIDKLCNILPSPFGGLCASFFELFGAGIIKLMEEHLSADYVCHGINLCKDQTAMCRLFPAPNKTRGFDTREGFARLVRRGRLRAGIDVANLRSFNICTILPEVCKVENHLPAFDSDGDKFSDLNILRGYYWRGEDCNDLDKTVFPGKNSTDLWADENCNGISGIDLNTLKSYEEEWCAGTGAMGVGILGDSATAHFRIPPGWLTASDLSLQDFSGVIRDAADELDWPMFSWSTASLNTTNFAPDIEGPVDSIYMELRRRNLCNNNDYQNMGVNGARVANLLPFAQLLGRTGTTGVKPMMLFMAMIGNDVCGASQSFEHFTTPQQYHDSVKEAVLYADTILAPGSKIVLVGLAQGSILYESMHNRIHPIGSTNKDVTYEDLYDFLNCLHVSPCWGWMNSNATIRNATQAHADLLSAQLAVVANETKSLLKNTEVLVIADWMAALKESPYPQWMLIEPVDGFHPSQWGNFLMAKYFINQTINAGFMPPVNPNNDAIRAKFGL